MTDHNARQAGLILGYTTLRDDGTANNRIIHTTEEDAREYAEASGFSRTEPVAVLAAHSADARNGEGVALTPERVNELGRVSFGKDWDERAYGIHTDSARHFAAAIEREVRALLAAPAAPAPTEPFSIDGRDYDDAAPAPAAQACNCRAGDCDGSCAPYIGQQPAPAAQAHSKDDGRVMMSAHALCPTDMSHPDRMRWMAKYFRENATAPECTCPSGNGSLRHPCPLHAGEPDEGTMAIRELVHLRECAAVSGFKSIEAAINAATPADAASEAELSVLRAVAAEYDACIRHMDAGGDFYAFQRERQQGAGDE